VDEGSDRRQDPGIRPPWSRSDRTVPRLVLRPLQEFLSTSTASATMLLGAALVALVWASWPGGSSYEAFWRTIGAVRLGRWAIAQDLRHWVNEGFMTFFFLVVGLEIKRELLTGELRRFRVALLPLIVAVSGMAVPALIYLTLVHGGTAGRGWGIPMATDIVFALGVLAIAGAGVPSGLRSLLLALAIVDDIGSLLVVAFLHPGRVATLWLVVVVGLAGLVVLFPRLHIRASAVYVGLGVAIWYGLFRAGLHPALAGVLVGLLTPVEPFQRPRAVSEEARRTADDTSDHPTPPDADAHQWLRLADLSREAVSPLARVEHLLLPWTSFVVLPFFALANVGVDLSPSSLAAAAGSAVAWGIVVARVLGKLVGIWGGAVLATRAGLVDLPEGVAGPQLAGMAIAAGTGFTVPLFIAQLAFAGTPLLDQARIALLAASVVSAVAGTIVLRRSAERRASHLPPPTI
jgi:NhaA family Na+:H+ antiporter